MFPSYLLELKLQDERFKRASAMSDSPNWLVWSLGEYGRVIHPPLVLLLCISGALGHLVTITTLSSMLNPTNMFLISMSCSQLALCVNFLYSTFFKWVSDELCQPLFFSYHMAKTMHVSVTLSVLVHMSGVFHVVAISVIRFRSLTQLASVNSNVPWFTYQKCRFSIAGIYALVLLLGIPLYFTSEVRQVPENEGCAVRFPSLKNRTSYQLAFSSFPYLQTLNFWLFHLCSKIIPSVILCVMTFLILDQLKKIRLLSARFASVERDKQYNRTTKIILIIMFIFIVVELPQGVLAVLSTMTTIHLLSELGDLTEMMTLLTSCIIFGLFCSMNGRIRSAFREAPCIRSTCWFLSPICPSQRPARASSARDRLIERHTIIIANCSVDKGAAL
ncbi:unnamed protein product [Caenorhabditis auriculariae]|uniref:G-protein coupled receptors family 1 profile domain-containing protein n=1 Tax=Caenorhabditis auriculariae TaxID=2777116 RepID=A0A8S1H9D4_9PELO|nr:unnamed protein product [Caenorhabditis auriculariae]